MLTLIPATTPHTQIIFYNKIQSISKHKVSINVRKAHFQPLKITEEQEEDRKVTLQRIITIMAMDTEHNNKWHQQASPALL